MYLKCHHFFILGLDFLGLELSYGV